MLVNMLSGSSTDHPEDHLIEQILLPQKLNLNWDIKNRQAPDDSLGASTQQPDRIFPGSDHAYLVPFIGGWEYGDRVSKYRKFPGAIA